MAFLSSDMMERRAREARRILQIDHQVHPDVVTMLFKLKNLGLLKDYDRRPDDEMGTDEAVYDPDTKLLKIKESSFSAANSDEARARFTLAHEIGHILLGHKRTRHRRIDYDRSNTASTIRNDEQQANMFAGAFLAPYHLAEMTLSTSAEALSDHFNISLAAAKIRLPELQRFYRIEHRILRPLPESVTRFLEQNRDLGRNRKR